MAPQRARLVVLAVLAGACAPTHPCESDVTKGPWVERASDTRATLLWESRAKGCVEAAFAPESGGVERLAPGYAIEAHVTSSWGVGTLKLADQPGTYYKNEVPLLGLAPGTCYRYRVRSSGALYPGEQVGRFCTARRPGDAFTFMGVGDTNPFLGHTIDTFHFTLPMKPDFQIHVGDMQYYSSVGETWVYWFQTMAPYLRSGALFPSVGNHENENNNLEYADYYGRLFVPVTDDPTLTTWFSFSWGGVWFFALDTEQPLDPGSPQVAWVTNALAGARRQPGYRFSVVYMHRPFYTLGDTSPELAARMTLEPIFEATGVKLVVAGHMHGYERFETPRGLTYVTCAGGGGVINNVNANVTNYPMDAPLRVVVSDHYHDCLWQVQTGTLSSTVIDEQGATIDQWQKAVP